jgi:transposase
MLNSNRIDTPAAAEYATVHVVFELSKANWKLGVLVPGAERPSIYTIAGADLKALAERLAAARAKAAGSGEPVRILSCYEAGLDGHWLHRWLTKQGVINYVVDPSSIEVNRRARRAKTDRIDVDKLMRTFLAYLRGEPQVCSMLRVPSVEEEDRKRRTRERERLQKERTAHSNQGRLHQEPRDDAHWR